LIKHSFGGVFLVSVSDLSKPALTHPTSAHPSESTASLSNAIIGDTLALLSAIFYAIYVVLLKVRIRFESRIDMQLFFGFVGVSTVFTCWPIGILLHLTKVERFEVPTSGMAITTILINVRLDFISPQQSLTLGFLFGYPIDGRLSFQ
jgi:solute carrier family 35 protein F5